VRFALALAGCLFASCADPVADFKALVKSFGAISDGASDARNAAGWGETVALNDISGSTFQPVPLSATGGIDLVKLRTGTRSDVNTDMDLDGKPGTGTAGEKVQAFSIAEGDFLSYAHPYKTNRTIRCLAWKTNAGDGYLLVKNPYDQYVTACSGTAGDLLPTTCKICGLTQCGNECPPSDPESCNFPPRDTDAGTP
jgi:hypothetical protein